MTIIAPQSALLNGAVNTDLVDIGGGASITDLDPFTLLWWGNVNTLTNQRVLYRKFGGVGLKLWRLSGTTGDVQMFVTRATTSTSYITNNTPLATLNSWVFLAASYSSAASAGQVVNIYKGDLVLPATECTYGTATDGSGSTTADATGNGAIGGGIAQTQSIQSTMSRFAICNRELSLNEVRLFQRWMLEWMRERVGYPGLVAAHALGANGLGLQSDLTGNKNDGTITGSSITRGIARPARNRILYAPMPSAGDDSVTESLTPGATQTSSADFVSARTESLTAAATEAAALTAAGARGETLSASDAATGVLAAGVTTTESLTATAVEVGALAAPVARAESLTAVDNQDASVVLVGTASAVESIGITDAQSATLVAAPLAAAPRLFLRKRGDFRIIRRS